MGKAGKKLSCTDCALNGCKRVDGQRPSFCPGNDFELEKQEWLQRLFADPDNRRVIEAATVSVNTAYFEKRSRLEETLIFARELGARTIGIAACVTLAPEARMAARVFEAHGFDVAGAICRVGCVTYGDLNLENEHCNDQTVLCNPMYQAKLLNDAHTDLNVIIGLCVGHDALFIKYSEALCTVLVSKDFEFKHCPIRALQEDDPSGELERLLGQ